MSNEKYFVIITGAAGNIGNSVASLFIDKGFKTLLTDKKNIDLDCGFKLSGDLKNQDFLKKLMAKIDFKKKIINVNCIGYTKDDLAIKQNEKDFDKIIDINLKSVFLLCKQLFRKCTKGAHIINLSSISGVQGRVGQSAYSAAKGALIAFTKSFAGEGARKNIRANIVLPGFIPSDITKNLNEKNIEKIKQTHILNRFQNTKEVSEFIFNLSLMENVSAQIFNLDSRINT